MNLVKMERTAAEKAEAEKRWKDGPAATSDYPYGLCINLGKDELEKLGLSDLPKVGETMQMMCMVKVTSVRQSASEQQNEDTKNVDLQITEMAVMPAVDKTAAADKLYPKKKAA